MDESGDRAQRVTIVLADDHAMVRGGLRRVLGAEPDLGVVAQAGDVETALRETRAHQPRIVVLDLNLPGIPTLDAIPDFLEAAPDCAVLVLTMDDEPASARTAMSSGAAGYVLKEAAETELVEAVRALLSDGGVSSHRSDRLRPDRAPGPRNRPPGPRSRWERSDYIPPEQARGEAVDARADI